MQEYNLHPMAIHLISLILLSFSLPTISTSPLAPPAFSYPKSTALGYTNLLIGNGGDEPNFSGGMIPSVSPPFAMTRWVAQTQLHYVSATPYNYTLDRVMGFVGTRQPAIWMGESAPISVCPGVGSVVVDFQKRGLAINKSSSGEKREVVSVGYYSVHLEDGHGGSVLVEQTATSRVAQFRFTFSATHELPAYILFDVARPSVTTSTPTNITYPLGSVSRLNSSYQLCGYSSERQDSIIAPVSIARDAANFKGYFCARFESDVQPVFGAIQNGSITYPFEQGTTVQGALLSAHALFPKSPSSNETVITLRVGTSFISEEQARTNLDTEIPDRLSPTSGVNVVPSANPTPLHFQAGTIENTAYLVRKSWTDILDRIEVLPYATGEQNEDDKRAIVDLRAFWTGVVHTLQYPSEQDEGTNYYSGYDNKIHHLPTGRRSYTGYSIWDTYRAAWAWQILFVPKKIPGMIWSMLEDYEQSGWLPMWKNIVETNIMIGTHADSLIAEAVLKNISSDFDLERAWEAVWKDATVGPENDGKTIYADREENVDFEVRAGLSSVYNDPSKGWVADDVHSESASRTLAYAYDDFAAYVLADALKKPANVTTFLYERAMRTPFTLFNDQTGFMEARNKDGSWAGDTQGWTEGDKWAYTFDVVHAIPELIKRRGGKVAFVQSLEAHFQGGHNEHSNEPSHHIPYLYALSGAAFKTQERVREIALANYDDSPTGLSGNEDCGQMSAWYIFSAMGFYPVNPVSGEYVVGSPFFEKITIELDVPSANGWRKRKLTITAPGARTKPYIKSLTINGMRIEKPIVRHAQLVGWENDLPEVNVRFEMSDRIEKWGNEKEVLEALGVADPLEVVDGQEAVVDGPFHEEL